jgi:tetratricopeptide (TPR) repeat protein
MYDSTSSKDIDCEQTLEVASGQTAVREAVGADEGQIFEQEAMMGKQTKEMRMNQTDQDDVAKNRAYKQFADIHTLHANVLLQLAEKGEGDTYWDDAEKAYEKAAMYYNKLRFVGWAWELSTVLFGQASVLDQKNEAEGALRLYIRAVEVKKKLHLETGEQCQAVLESEIADTLEKMATLYRDQGRELDAENTLNQAASFRDEMRVSEAAGFEEALQAAIEGTSALMQQGQSQEAGQSFGKFLIDWLGRGSMSESEDQRKGIQVKMTNMLNGLSKDKAARKVQDREFRTAAALLLLEEATICVEQKNYTRAKEQSTLIRSVLRAHGFGNKKTVIAVARHTKGMYPVVFEELGFKTGNPRGIEFPLGFTSSRVRARPEDIRSKLKVLRERIQFAAPELLI